MKPTMDDAKRYCPLNSKGRGDNQISLFEDCDEGTCQDDHEKCHYLTCSILKNIMEKS
jgi:hypothetical protein